jgi:hypothetical protein
VSKTILGTPGQLTPHSDPIVVARAILAAHDAAELAAATVAGAVGADVNEGATLMKYPPAIVKCHPIPAMFPGRNYLDQLNRARRDFKHAGILPNVVDWYRVTDNAARYIGSWCEIYLSVDFDALSAYELLTNTMARDRYRQAEEAYNSGHYQEALEHLARALVHALTRAPRIPLPEVGVPDTHQALLLTAFGVSPSEFLTLQELLPTCPPGSTNWGRERRGRVGYA